MKVGQKHYRTIWLKPENPGVVQIIDQRKLPFGFVVEDLRTVGEVCAAIADMHVRGAGCIGATAGYGMYIAALESLREVEGVGEAERGKDFDAEFEARSERLRATRPTAINLAWAITRQLEAVRVESTPREKVKAAMETANRIADEDAAWCRRIGEHGLSILEELRAKKNGDPVNVLTHCNAGWLAFVDHGSATSPIYAAHDAGIPVHVWVDETRPRNQGARLTAWELGEHGVPHTVIADNTGGHLMQKGMVDVVITGTDRTTRTGDVANKIGTYLKALAAMDNGVPFYVALPSSTFDWERRDGAAEIPIEQRGEEEVTWIEGVAEKSGEVTSVRLTPEGSAAANFAFDVTPARLVRGLITERGICAATEEGILDLFPEHRG